MKDIKLVGKMLVRVCELNETSKGGDDRTHVITFTGMFSPQNFDIKEIEGDEMWVAEVVIKEGGIRFTEPTILSISPEDFLEGEGTSPSCWKNKTKL